MTTKILVTGGSGFIGKHLVELLVAKENVQVMNVDILSYAASECVKADNYVFLEGDIADRMFMHNILHTFSPDIVINLAAETHVDRSISDSEPFLYSNVIGTHNLVCEVHNYIKTTGANVRFIHMSTDEVFGELEAQNLPFTEESPYRPRSPYAASKAAADHFIWSYIHTHKFPAIIMHCCNNYGPYQYPEKFIPVIITKALNNESIPVYGQGLQIRNWIHARDTALAIWEIAKRGELYTNYNISDFTEISNIDLTKLILYMMNKPESLIQYVTDRKGHDFRYSLNSQKLRRTLGWRPLISFHDGLRETINWYTNNVK